MDPKNLQNQLELALNTFDVERAIDIIKKLKRQYATIDIKLVNSNIFEIKPYPIAKKVIKPPYNAGKPEEAKRPDKINFTEKKPTLNIINEIRSDPGAYRYDNYKSFINPDYNPNYNPGYNPNYNPGYNPNYNTAYNNPNPNNYMTISVPNVTNDIYLNLLGMGYPEYKSRKAASMTSSIEAAMNIIDTI
jgi:hypothetical protein